MCGNIKFLLGAPRPIYMSMVKAEEGIVTYALFFNYEKIISWRVYASSKTRQGVVTYALSLINVIRIYRYGLSYLCYSYCNVTSQSDSFGFFVSGGEDPTADRVWQSGASPFLNQ